MKSYKNYKKLTPIEAIQLVKDSIGIEAVLDYYAGISIENVKGRKTKLISCIFHQERTPSLAITPSKNVFHCFGCQARGDIITLVSLLKNISQARAAYIIAEDFGLLEKVSPQLKQSVKEKAIDKELERNFRQKEKELFDFLLQAKQHIQAITKNIKNERDIQRKGGLYHIIPKIEYYLDLLSGYEDFSPEGRIDNYILIQRFIGKEIYPIYKAALEKEMEGGIPMSESWMEALKKKAQEAQAPYLLAINADLQSKEEPQQEDKRYLPSPMKDIVIPKGFEAREEGLYFVPDKDEKPPVFICSEYVLITGRYGNITHGTEGLIVSWFQDNKWKKLKRSRDNFMVQSKLVELSAFGFPVSSLNQRLMVQYLTALERANLENILHLRV